MYTPVRFVRNFKLFLLSTLGLLLLVSGEIANPAINRAKAGPSLSQGMNSEESDYLKHWTEWFVNQRAYPLARIPTAARLRAWQQLKARPPQRFVAPNAVLPGNWNPIGPAPITEGATSPSNPTSGRVTAISVSPRDQNTIFLGSAQGGVWKSTNGGNSWVALTDDQATLAVGSIAIYAGNPDVIYVGTGEGNGSCDSYFGAGILKSTNGGNTWTQLGASAFEQVSISKILVSPTNSNLLYAFSMSGVAGIGCDFASAAAPAGFYKSTDGGQTWSAIRTYGYLGASDAVMDPQDSNILYYTTYLFNYATNQYEGRIYKYNASTGNVTNLNSGLPTPSDMQRTSLAISHPDGLSATLYAGVSRDNGTIYKSTDGGNTWTRKSTGATGYCGAQCWYDNVMAVNPTDPLTAYAGGTGNFGAPNLVRTDDGGASWTEVGDGLHTDVHAIAFDPTNSRVMYNGNDGGIFKTTTGGQAGWSSVNSNLNITQFENIAQDPSSTTRMIGGTQDNGTLVFSGTSAWDSSDWGDGGFTAIDPLSPETWYHTFNGATPNRSDVRGAFGTWYDISTATMQGDPHQFYPPMVVDSHSSKLYLGTNRVWRYNKSANSWSAISGALAGDGAAISALAVAPSDGNIIYAGSSDGQVWVYNGSNWSRLNKSPLPTRYVTQLAVDPNNAQRVVVTFSGFTAATPNQPGHVFVTTNGGGAWQNVSGNLPDVPVNAVTVDPNESTTIYLGTDVGVLATGNLNGTNTNWSDFGIGFPNVAVFSLSAQKFGLTTVLAAATHGRGVWTQSLAYGPDPTPTATPFPTTPAAPTLLTPLKGGKAKNPVTLSWSDSSGATYYQVQVRQGSTTGTLVHKAKPTAAQDVLPNLVVGSFYYWRVRACDNNDCSGWSPYWSFKVKS